jgi:hypothetical protein
VRDVSYTSEAAAAADTAQAIWPRAEEVILALEWTLARDRNPGLPYEGGLRLIVFEKAKSGGLPGLDCLFELTPDKAVIHELEFY